MVISQGLLIFLISGVIISLIFAVISLTIALYASIRIIAVEKSTHTVTYQPINEEVDKENRDFIDKWATTEGRIAKDQEDFSEQLEADMPDFFPNDDDRKIHSF